MIDRCTARTAGVKTARKQKASENSAYGMLAWKGYDLTKSKGVRRAKKERRRLRPKDRWVSTPSGPRSRMQKRNQRRAAQVLERKEKRAVNLMIPTNDMTIAFDHARKLVQ